MVSDCAAFTVQPSSSGSSTTMCSFYASCTANLGATKTLPVFSSAVAVHVTNRPPKVLQLQGEGPDPYDVLGVYVSTADGYAKAGKAGPATLLTYEEATGYTIFSKRFGAMAPVYQLYPVYRRANVVSRAGFPVVQWYPTRCMPTDLAVKRMCTSIAGACEDSYVRCDLSSDEMATFLVEYRRYPEGGRSLPFPRTSTVRSLLAGCPAFLASDRFVGKIVFSEDRVEVVVDIDKFGHHYAGVDLRPGQRDVVFRSLGEGVGKAVLVVATVAPKLLPTDADAVAVELGLDSVIFKSEFSAQTVPLSILAGRNEGSQSYAGYSGLAVPVVIRVERFQDNFEEEYYKYATSGVASSAEGSYYYEYECGLCEDRPAEGRPCATVEAPFDFEVYPTVSGSIAVFRLVYKGSATVAELEPLSSTGGVVSLLPSGGHVVRALKDGDYIVLADKDECAGENPCPAHMRCTNTVGSFECECQPPFRAIGPDECAPPLDCEESTIAVRNAAQALGIRIRDVSLHLDAECSRSPSLMVKKPTVETSASHDMHPSSLLLDKKGVPRGKKHGAVTGNDFQNTEWWAAQYSAGPDEMSVMVKSPNACGVRSIAVFVDIDARDWTECDTECWTRPDRTMPVTPGPLSFSWAPTRSPGFPPFSSPERSIPPTGIADTLRDGAGMNKFVQSWLVTEESVISQSGSVCLALDCGTRELYYQTEPRWTPRTETACDCKQQCLDLYKEGCRAFQFRIIEDVNWDPTNTEHHHGDCRLFDRVIPASKATNEFYAGTIAIVDGVSGKDLVEGGTVTVTGIGLEVSTQRLKLVLAQEVDDETMPFVSSADVCEGLPPATIAGIACSSPGSCTPSPSVTNPTNSSWPVTIYQTGRISRYVACHCLRGCDNVLAYAAVPGYVELPAAAMTWSLSAKSPSPDALFMLTVSVPDLSMWAPAQFWRVKVLNATEDCADGGDGAALTWAATSGVGVDEFEQPAIGEVDRSAQYRTSLPVGRYTVCACVVAAARNLSSSSDADCEYGQISATTGDKVFTIRSGLKPRASHGYNRTQRTSGSLVRVGEAKTNYSGYPYDTIREIRKTVDFSLTGWGLAQYTPPITVGTSACPGTIEALLSFATPDEAFFSAALSAGTYILCSDGDLVARLAVTGRAAAGVWAAAARNRTDNPYDAGNYTPLSAPLSLEDMDGVAVEIQGYGLNTSDRIALLGENRTCGIDEGGSELGLRAGGVTGAAPFEMFEAHVIHGGGLTQLFSRVEGRACPTTPLNDKRSGYFEDPEGLFNAYETAVTCETACVTTKKGKKTIKTCQPCGLEKCLRDCYNMPANKCAAVTISRTGSGCTFYPAICSVASSALDATQDTYFKRFEYGTADVHRALKSNLTTLSFAPVAVTHARGAALKVCFCDSALHPTCSKAADFDVELGRLHISGATCQAARPLAATHDCRHQDHSGLACVPKPLVQESGRSIAMVSAATVTVMMSTTFIWSQSDLTLLRSFPGALSSSLLEGLAKGLGVPMSAVKILATDPDDWRGDLSSLTVEYSVTGDAAVSSTLEKFVDGDTEVVAGVAAAIEAALASQSLDRLPIVSVNSSYHVGGGGGSVSFVNATNTSRI